MSIKSREEEVSKLFLIFTKKLYHKNYKLIQNTLGIIVNPYVRENGKITDFC
jgi:hypothetical protein